MTENDGLAARRVIEDEARSAKRRLRILVEERVLAMSPAERESADAAIAERVIGHPEWIDAHAVLLYRSLPYEVGTDGLLEAALSAGKELYLPRITGDRMGFHRVADRSELRRLSPHRFGMFEPPAHARRWESPHPWRPAIVVCPGRVFDMRGGRIGHGGGFYDRFLAGALPIDAPETQLTVAGICYETQLVEEVPTHSNDHPIDIVFTEQRIVLRRIEPDTGIV